MSFKFRLVVVGGTFDSLHAGHKFLIKRAFEEGERVIIGLSTDSFASKLKSYKVEPYEKRKKRLEALLKELGVRDRALIVPLSDYFGIAIEDPKIEAILATPENEDRCRLINKIREERNLPKLHIIKIDLLLAEDGKPISSSRIKAGIITPNGKLLENTNKNTV